MHTIAVRTACLALAAAALAGCGECGLVKNVESAGRFPAEDATEMKETKGQVTFKGKPLTLLGEPAAVGDAAPDFAVLANDLSEVKLSDFRGRVVLIASVPSLDTGVCDIETRRFNEEAAALGDVKVLAISMDLPFAQKRWCGAAGAENVQTLSDHRAASFGLSYGVLIKELRLLARSVWVIDRKGKIVYVERVKEMAGEPDYQAALAAARAALK